MDSPAHGGTLDKRGTEGLVHLEAPEPEAHLDPRVFLELWAQQDLRLLGLWETEGPRETQGPWGSPAPLGPQDPKESSVPVSPRTPELQERRA